MYSTKAFSICIPASGSPAPLPALDIVNHLTFLPISWAENDCSLFLSFAFALLLVKMNIFFISTATWFLFFVHGQLISFLHSPMGCLFLIDLEECFVYSVDLSFVYYIYWRLSYNMPLSSTFAYDVLYRSFKFSYLTSVNLFLYDFKISWKLSL